MTVCDFTNIEGLLGLGSSAQALRVVLESIRLKLFDALYGRPLSSATLARKLSVSSEALERLLNVLSAMGLVEKKGSLYRVTGVSRQYLCRQSRYYLGDFFIHRESLQKPWSDLAYSLKKNIMKKPVAASQSGYQKQLKKFMMAMDALGRVKAEILKEKINVKKYKSMLDLGGGVGTYSVSFCRDNKNLKAVVFDLKDVARNTAAYVKKAGMQKQIRVVSGQCLSDSLPEGPFDLVFISNLLHIYNERDCLNIIKKAASVLTKGGTLAIHDYIFGCGDSLAVSLFDMTMLVGTPQGKCYGREEIGRWLKAAGVKKIKTDVIMAGTSVVWGVR